MFFVFPAKPGTYFGHRHRPSAGVTRKVGRFDTPNVR
jgi:hypothetical protein